jgi:uncharacterized protein YecE (DUF72 family)
MAQLRVGTSGYAYKEWKGKFYPATLRQRDWLAYYSQQFPTVEINHTFYQMPREATLETWSQSVPSDFQFALKGNQRITHVQKLTNAEALVRRFLEAASVLGAGRHLGPILFQLPPSFPVQLEALEQFLRLRPRAFRFAIEFRHPSWLEPSTYRLLREHQTALCLADTDEQAAPEVVTTDFVYVRLRRENYTAAELTRWREQLQEWVGEGRDVYAYLKHEEAGRGPAYARRLLGAEVAEPTGV